MARKKLPSRGLRILVVLGVLLIIAQGAIWLTREEPLTIQEVHERKLAAQSGLEPRRKQQLRIQLAVSDYTAKNGAPPKALNDLTPIYFDRVPVDPETSKAFAYEVQGTSYYVGAREIEAHKTGTTLTKNAHTQGVGQGTDTTKSEEEELLSSLDDPTALSYVYDPVGKRDPFEPFNLAPKADNADGKTGLERFVIGQLRLTAVLKGFDEPLAIVEDATGKGHTVTKGTKIGPNGGEIVEILPDRLLILEKLVDFTGKEQSNTIEMRLRAPGTK